MGPEKYGRLLEKIAPEKYQYQFWGIYKANAPNSPRWIWIKKHGFLKTRGHKLAKVLAIRAEYPSRHTVSVSLSQIWPSEILGDGRKIRSNQNMGFQKKSAESQGNSRTQNDQNPNFQKSNPLFPTCWGGSD